jgi:phosphoenolpyruvate---glycerone phosphotransferase subunit DhaL
VRVSSPTGNCGAYVKRIQQAILSELASPDSGINMAKGAALARDAAAGRAALSIAGALRLLGETLLMRIGGSMGPLYGSFFLGLAERAPSDDEATTAVGVARMFSNGLAEVRALTSAQVGDKTMIDSLEPAVAELNRLVDAGATLEDSLDGMCVAAEAGATHTAEIPARFGRAARIGDRSIGTVDAGAASCALIIRTIADAMREEGGADK